MTIPTSTLQLTDFIVNDLPTKRWMKFVRPRMRLRVHAQNRDFVSPTVEVDGRSLDGANFCNIHWPWYIERPTVADNEGLEIMVERRFLFWYKCIRRTKSMKVCEVRTDDLTTPCMLPLYDGQHSAEELERENKFEIGGVMFQLKECAGVNKVPPASKDNVKSSRSEHTLSNRVEFSESTSTLVGGQDERRTEGERHV